MSLSNFECSLIASSSDAAMNKHPRQQQSHGAEVNCSSGTKKQSIAA